MIIIILYRLYGSKCFKYILYEYDKESNEATIIDESGDIKNEESYMWFWTTEYTFQNNGFDYHIIYDNIKGEALACFFITSNSNIYY